MGMSQKKRKILGPGPCHCEPLHGDPQVSKDTLICSRCGFVATAVPVFTAKIISEQEMRNEFGSSWDNQMRDAYRYLFDLMKPEEENPLQAARTAFFKVEEWRRMGLFR